MLGRMRIYLVLTLLGLGACGGKDSCNDAVDHAMALSITAETKDIPADKQQYVKDATAAMTKAAVERCQADKWSKEELDCLKTATKGADVRACEKLLTPEQTKALNEAVGKAGRAVPEPAGEGQIDKDATIKGITEQRDRMCACKDAACAEAVDKDWKQLKRSSEHARHDEDTKKEFNKIDDERFKCFQALTKK
jgi:hypothetical protein